MHSKSIKTITLSRLLQVFLIAILIVITVVALTYRSFFKSTAENKILAISEVVKSGLTAHMKSGIMDKRDYFLREIASVDDIEQLEIVRAPAVISEYGVSKYTPKLPANTLKSILQTKEVSFEWNDLEGNLHAMVPYIASDKGSLNCLQCHHVKEGEVLGVVDIRMNISKYQDLVLKYSYIIAIVLATLALLIILNMFHVIEHYIRQPLSRIIHDGQKAYSTHKIVSSEPYKSHELKEVVRNINDFNHEVLQKEEALETKNRELTLLNEEIELTIQETMLAMGKMEELRSKDTKNHAKRVSVLCGLIAKEYGLSEEDVKLITIASPLHDIGKVGIADSILNKPAKLTDEEFEIMKSHTDLGYDVLRHSQQNLLHAAAVIAYSHHEKYDGSGYPLGLNGDAIPVFGRIVAIVDVLDALLSQRVYKEKWSIEKVVALFEAESGKHFEPKLVAIVLENIDAYAKLIRELSES